MTPEQKKRIEQIDQKIIALMLKRAQVRRRGTWAEEQAVYEQITKLEEEIKSIK